MHMHPSFDKKLHKWKIWWPFLDNQIALIIKWHVKHVQHGNQRLLFNLVANYNVINSPHFCFQNCNKCWIVFPKLTLIGMSCFLISVCSGGISTLHASHVCPSQFSMPLPWPHPQLLMFPLFPIFHCQSHPILLFICPFKNQT